MFTFYAFRLGGLQIRALRHSLLMKCYFSPDLTVRLVVVGFWALFLIGACNSESEPRDLAIDYDVPSSASIAILIDLEFIRSTGLTNDAIEELSETFNRSLGNGGLGVSDVDTALSVLMNDKRIIIVEGEFVLDDINEIDAVGQS